MLNSNLEGPKDNTVRENWEINLVGSKGNDLFNTPKFATNMRPVDVTKLVAAAYHVLDQREIRPVKGTIPDVTDSEREVSVMKPGKVRHGNKAVQDCVPYT